MTDPNPNDNWLARMKPLPEKHAVVELAGTLTADDYPHFAAGFWPTSPQDKWVIYFDDNWLNFYRASSGTLIYKLRIEPHDDHYVMPILLVNREPAQYRNSDINYDIQMLGSLIDRLLLKRQHAPIPMPKGVSKQHAQLHEQYVMGQVGPPQTPGGFIALDGIQPLDPPTG